MTNKAQKPHYCKTDVISSCDCLVGFLSGEKVNKSTIDYEVERIVNIQPTFKKYGLLNGEPQTKSQIVDGRKGYLSRFVYCLIVAKNLIGSRFLAIAYNLSLTLINVRTNEAN